MCTPQCSNLKGFAGTRDPTISISISIARLSIRTFVGIMSSLLAPKIGDGAQVPHHWSGMMLSTISSIAILLVVGVGVGMSSVSMASMGMRLCPPEYGV